MQTETTANPPMARSTMISNASIFIVSIYLIGMASGHAMPDNLRPFIMGSGMTGIVAYLALEHVKKSRFQNARRKSRSLATRVLTHRLHRHISDIAAEPAIQHAMHRTLR